MKGAALALLCAAALVSAELNENGCPINPYVDILKPHPICNKFYQCVQGELIERKCASDLTFNEETQECDWAVNVDCGERPVAPESKEDSENDSNANRNSNESGNNSNSKGDSSNEDSENNSSSNESEINTGSNSSSNEHDSDSNNNGSGNGKPGEAEEICSRKDSNGVLVPHEDCDKFYKCSYGVPVALFCNSGLLYNIEKEYCDWPENVNCKSRNQGGNGDNDNDNNSGHGDADKDDDEADKDEGNNDNNNNNNENGHGDNDNNNNSGNGNADKDDDEADKDEGNNDHNNNNNNGNGNPAEAPKICARKGSDGVLVAHENCNQFYKCSEGVPVALSCNLNLLYNIEKEYCDWPENVNCKSRNQGGNGDNDNDNNSGHGDADKDDDEADKDEGNNDNNNNNNENGHGDNDNNNNSGNGNADKDDDEADKDEGNNDHNNNNNNNNNGNGNPAEAPKICARKGSDGVLVAHENCNQFYKCSEGVPVALSCNLNLLYNIEKEYCDWPENVNCKSRNQGGNGDNDNDNNSGHGDADKDDDEADKGEGNNDNNNNNNENGHGDNDNNNNTGNGNADKDDDEADKDEGNNDHNNNNNNGNGNPAEAPKICARKGSDGVLVAHENCNQFYKCSEGVPVALSCNLNLLYNIEKEYCDWPENVNCEGRHGGKGNDNHSENGEADKEDEETNGGDENVGGNSDPSQALVICAKEGSDNALVAHENCNQFYVCRDGLPLTLDCNPNLVYNPVSSSCDWPENVDCDTRRVFTSLNKHMRFVKQFA